jgi:hypothetical protein
MEIWGILLIFNFSENLFPDILDNHGGSLLTMSETSATVSCINVNYNNFSYIGLMLLGTDINRSSVFSDFSIEGLGKQ